MQCQKLKGFSRSLSSGRGTGGGRDRADPVLKTVVNIVLLEMKEKKTMMEGEERMTEPILQKFSSKSETEATSLLLWLLLSAPVGRSGLHIRCQTSPEIWD